MLRNRFVSLLALTLLMAFPLAVTADSPTFAWHDSGFRLAESVDGLTVCFDATQPTTLIVRDGPILKRTGTVAYNWATGEKRTLNARVYDACGEQTGFFFARNPDGGALRFSAADPTGMTIDHFPTNIAMDGSPILYAVSPPQYTDFLATTLKAPGHLWVSADSGATWVERGAEFGGKITEVAPVDADARAVYALVQERVTDPAKHVVATLYFSADAGATWEKRAEQNVGLFGSLEWPFVDVTRVPGQAASATTIQFETRPGYPGSSSYSAYFLSTDGGRTFTSVGTNGLGVETHLIATSGGIVRLNLRGTLNTSDGYILTRTTDGGATWQPLALPYMPELDTNGSIALIGAPSAPATLILTNRHMHSLYYSTDAGTTWQPLAEQRTEVKVSLSAPLTLIGFGVTSPSAANGQLYTLDISSLMLP